MSTTQGTLAEQIFTVEAIRNCFRVARPIEPCAYDFILEKDTHLFRIQVKSCFRKKEKGRKTYQINVGQRTNVNRTYDINAFDYYAIYIQAIDQFYLIPINKCAGQTLRINPEDHESLYVSFRNNWALR